MNCTSASVKCRRAESAWARYRASRAAIESAESRAGAAGCCRGRPAQPGSSAAAGTRRASLSRERDTLLNSATEEFLRFYTPAPGDGRTISADCEIGGTSFKEGDRLWLSWAMANRDPAVFEDPNQVDMARKGNRHSSFGLGIHRCIGSNVARTVFKRMVIQVLDRMPDYQCDPEGAVHYETIGVIQGMRQLPATFTPGQRLGAGLDETLATLQKVCDEQRLAEPVTARKASAKIPE